MFRLLYIYIYKHPVIPSFNFFFFFSECFSTFFVRDVACVSFKAHRFVSREYFGAKVLVPTDDDEKKNWAIGLFEFLRLKETDKRLRNV